MKINNITGSPVEGDNFYGREKELDHAWKRIQKGNSLILSAPRRVGKSSFAKKILTKAKVEDWNILEINFEEVKSEEGFVTLFIEKLRETSWWENSLHKTGAKLSSFLESLKPSLEYGDASVSFEWKSNKENVYAELKSQLNHNKQTLIMVDELTILLNKLLENENGIQDVVFLLNWMRSFRQVSGTKIRWILCSSIGIENFATQHNLSYTLNDVDNFKIDEFKRLEAISFIELLASSENLTFTDEQIEYMLDKLGWNLPYFIQILFSRIDQLIQLDSKIISEETIDEAYQQLIKENHLSTWHERLKEYGKDEKYARWILTHLSKTQQGETRNNLLNVIASKAPTEVDADEVLANLLTMLQNDGYIIDTQDSKYLFRSPLLRDFWFNRFVK